ncbi:lipid-A-disaccharide synthase [Profundibacterium mesophilum]|uniref:Lipid-A-disaccharide synthase n=1 Tax=Profundibacterium mesophilum KAUST100406-0324 TaxID=1037889 RepID=A0A921NUV2_9RHOB|nr:lipid-A-disaccharide synthase [Profundibacterium mesophilum]KAF0675219.1 Lipid-A-disaccharide synthase [Profundibacterium mesophilum KAUST100406-0324]
MRVFLIAGEPSGDRLGAALMRGLRVLQPDVQFAGVGGDEMTGEGLRSLFPMQELSVMGITEVLPRYPSLRRRMVETADAVIEAEPDVLITIDSPDFCLRVARRVRAASPLRIVHYVAPSVWAWRPGRARKMAAHVDQVLALLPFEPPYMEAAGMRCDFVGHPVAEEPQANVSQRADFRRDWDLGEAPLLLVLPGSRKSEVERLMPVFAEAVEMLAAARPDLRIVIPAAAPVIGRVRELAARWPHTPLILDPAEGEDPASRKRAAFGAADMALAASGTVSLELAAAGTPMVIAYDMSWLSWQVMSRMVRIESATLVNLVTDTKMVPEFLGPDCRPGPIAGALIALAQDPGRQDAVLDAAMTALGRGGEEPGLRAARAVLAGIAGLGEDGGAAL